MKKTLIFFLSLLLAGQLFAQEEQYGKIQGMVIDEKTKQPLPGGNVMIKTTNNGTTTDSDGFFSIENLKTGLYNLEISYIGYQTEIVTDIRVTPAKTSYIETELKQVSKNVKEVTVKTFRFENNPLTPISNFALSKEEIYLSPGSQSDILRTIGMLPGVQSSGGEFSAIAVRGQSIFDNVYMVDGIPMYSLGHFEGYKTGFNNPNGGRFSVLPPRSVQSAEFIAGGFPSQYGRRNSAYLGIDLNEGNPVNPSIEGQLDMMGGMINYDGPSYIHENTSIFASLRYQNFKQIFKISDMLKDGVPEYGDFIFKSTTRFGKKHKLSIIGIHNRNHFVKDINHLLCQDEIVEDHLADSKENKSVFGINLRTITSKNSYWRNIFYYRDYRKDYHIGKAYLYEKSDGSLPDENEVNYIRDLLIREKNDREIGYRSVFTYNFDNGSRIHGGIDLFNLDLDFSRNLRQKDTSYVFDQNDFHTDTAQKYIIHNPEDINTDFNDNAYNFSSYIRYSFDLFRNLHLNVGVRHDYYGFINENSISPRLSGKLQLNRKNSINFATGIYYQDVLPEKIADSWDPGNLKPKTSTHYILGYKRYFTPSFKFTIEGYYKNLDNLTVRQERSSKSFSHEGTGYAYGMDFSLVKRLTDKFSGQIGYSYMQSKRNDHNGQGKYDYMYSMPHIFSSYARYTINKKWIMSAKFRYFTGKPADKYIIHKNVLDNRKYMRYSKEITDHNADRLDDYISLDVRIDYRLQFDKFAFIAFLDVANVTDRLNPNYTVFQERTGEVEPKGIKMFPTFGLKFEL